MTVTDFKKQLAKCPDQPAVERLMQSWHALRATSGEYAELREAVISKVDEFGSGELKS